jgi:Zn-dependent M28 family amino/carboxypeptidase
LNVAGAEPKKGIPTIYISTDIANEILSGSKSTVQLAKQKISKTKSPLTLDFTVPFSLNIKRKTDPIKAENVLGYLAGSDLKNELVVITAHYDHLGVDGKTIYYGADDDGSGTAAVMELAKAFAIAKKTGQGPRRSILFMTVAGEEKGLLGSQYYSENPAFPLSNTVADLNIDMIGRIDDKHKGNPNYIYIIGSDKLSTDLHKINEKANKTYTKLDLDYTYNDPKDPNRYYYRSDHYNFAKHNIPVIFYFNGVHADYHKPTDTVDKINFEKMEKITQLVFFTAWDLANRNSRIKVDIVNDFKGER